MKSLFYFLSYHNAVPITFGILFLGATGAAAASPEVRDAVFEASQEIRSVDNSRIINADIDAYPFEILITGVTEDDEFYYVAYTLQSIEIIDYVWQDITKQLELKVSKEFLKGQDLGTYASKQIAEVRDAEKVRLKETQVYEKEIGLSRKVVATVYAGLVGQFVEPAEEVVPEYKAPPGYVVPTPVTASIASTNSSAPRIQIFGNNPAVIALNTSYVDLGALVTDDIDENLGVHTYIDGTKVSNVSLDTSVEGRHEILYRATDTSGNVGEATRIVYVGITPGEPEQPTATSTPSAQGDESASGTTTPTGTQTSSQPTSTPSAATSSPSTGSGSTTPEVMPPPVETIETPTSTPPVVEESSEPTPTQETGTSTSPTP